MPSCPPCMTARLALLSPVRHCVQNEGLLHSVNCRHAYRHDRLPTPLSHPSSRKHRSCLLRSCCSSPMHPHFLHNDANDGVNFLNTATYISLLSVDCAWFQLPPRLPPRPSTNPTFTSFLTQTPIILTKELLQLPGAPSLLAQRCQLWRELPEHRHLRFVTVCGLRVVCIPTISYLHCQNKPPSSLYHTFIARTNPKTLRGLARALSESALLFYPTSIIAIASYSSKKP